jgi:hypothetical protein
MCERNRPEFSVAVFADDGRYYYVKRFVHGADAVLTFIDYAHHAHTSCKHMVRVIITDGGDFTCAEWKRGKGFTYPPELVARNATGRSTPSPEEG